MADAGGDDALRRMARDRGLRLVKSRRRKRGGDRGRFGLADADTGAPCFGYGEAGFEATAADVEAFLRDRAKAAWRKSVRARTAAIKRSR